MKDIPNRPHNLRCTMSVDTFINEIRNGRLTVYIEVDLTRVLARLVASDTRVVAGVERLDGVDDERMDAVLVDHDLM